MLSSDKENTYENCVQNELKSIFEEQLNCTPPLIARKTDQVCDERFHVSRHMSNKLYAMFLNNYQDFEPVHCKKPCTQTKYEIEKIAGLTEEDYLVIKLTFKPFVYVTRSTYSISVIDTITSLGGSVSNYKTLSSYS